MFWGHIQTRARSNHFEFVGLDICSSINAALCPPEPGSVACPACPLGTPLCISIDAADIIPLFDNSQNFELILSVDNLNLVECLAHHNCASIFKCVVSRKLTKNKTIVEINLLVMIIYF